METAGVEPVLLVQARRFAQRRPDRTRVADLVRTGADGGRQGDRPPHTPRCFRSSYVNPRMTKPAAGGTLYRSQRRSAA